MQEGLTDLLGQVEEQLEQLTKRPEGQMKEIGEL
jgi:hypothetical protein